MRVGAGKVAWKATRAETSPGDSSSGWPSPSKSSVPVQRLPQRSLASMPRWMLPALTVNWRSEAKTPFWLNGRTVRSESMPCRAEKSTRPSGITVSLPKSTPLVDRAMVSGLPLLRAAATALSRSARNSAVISRASSSMRPSPNRLTEPRSLENCGSSVSKSALSKPSEMKALAEKSPAPPRIGTLWQDWQLLESSPAVRRNMTSTGCLRSVGMIAWVAIGRPRPSAVVKRAVKRCLAVLRPAALSWSAVSAPSNWVKSTWSWMAFSAHGSHVAGRGRSRRPATPRKSQPPLIEPGVAFRAREFHASCPRL